MPEPQGRLVYWPLLAPWGPRRRRRAGERILYLSFPSWEGYLAGPPADAPLPDGLPAPPALPRPDAEPLLAPEPPNFLKSLASLWTALSRGEPLAGALPLPCPADPADSAEAIRRALLAPPSPPAPGRTATEPRPAAARAGLAPSPVPPELVLALWTLGAFAGLEAEGHLREAARWNAGLLDALKGPLPGDDPGELAYEAAGLSGLRPAWAGGGAPPGGGRDGGERGIPGDGGRGAEVDPAPPADLAAPSPWNAALLRDLWLRAARPLLRPGDRLTASGDGFEGLLEGMLPSDPRQPGDYLYADL